MKNRRGEIATLLTIGALAVIGITTVVSSLNINKQKSSSARAGCAGCTVGTKCYVYGEKDKNGSMCCASKKNPKDTKCTWTWGTWDSTGTCSGCTAAAPPAAVTPVATPATSTSSCKPQTCGSFSTNPQAGYSSKTTGGSTKYYEKGACTVEIPQGIGTYCKSQNGAAPPAGVACQYATLIACQHSHDTGCTTDGCSGTTAKYVTSTSCTPTCSAANTSGTCCDGKTCQYDAPGWSCRTAPTTTGRTCATGTHLTGTPGTQNCSMICEAQGGLSISNTQWTENSVLNCCCRNVVATPLPAGVTPSPALYPQNNGRTPGMACCFKQGERVRVYAHASARENNGMNTPCTTASYGNAYGATAWFECPDNTPETGTAEEYEAANTPVEETATECQQVENGLNCPTLIPGGHYVINADGGRWCCPAGVQPSTTETPGENTDPNAPCVRHGCKDLSPSFSTIKSYYQKGTVYYSASTCTDSSAYADMTVLELYCSEGVIARYDADCKAALADPNAQCILNPLGFGTGGYEKTDIKCGPLHARFCYKKTEGTNYILRKCSSIDPNYSPDANVYEKDGQYYVLKTATNTYELISGADLDARCSLRNFQNYDNQCRLKLKDPTAQCVLLLPPFGGGYEKTDTKCGPIGTNDCWTKKPDQIHRIEQDTVVGCEGNIITDPESGLQYCEGTDGVLIPVA